MKKLVKEMTLEEYKKYGNLRASDGNWSKEMALTCATFLSSLPKRKLFESKKKYNSSCEKYYQENLPLLWNFEDYPNMKLDIETGELELLWHSQ